jgi:hypothetical protein
MSLELYEKPLGSEEKRLGRSDIVVAREVGPKDLQST